MWIRGIPVRDPLPPIYALNGAFEIMAFILKNGSEPASDGDAIVYEISPVPEGLTFDRNRRVVFINGMMNSAADHARSARKLSEVQACPVLGIFNKSSGFDRDIVQCIKDKVTLVGPQAGNFPAWEKAVNDAYLSERAAQPNLGKKDYVATIVAGNKATLSLYHYVSSIDAETRRALKIFCHSQGNLITSNALTAVALALGPNADRWNRGE